MSVPSSNHVQWRSLLIFVALAGAAAAAGSLAMPDAWFAALAKPSFNPPSWIFAPVWTVLYLMMAIAAWRVFRAEGIKAAIVVWGVQLIFNAAWSPLFFGLHRIDLATIDIVLLLGAIVATLFLFLRADRLAGALLVPYLCWVSFATALTFSIWHLNP